MSTRSLLALAATTLAVLTACGDDANDGAYRARRAADLAAELRTEQAAAAAREAVEGGAAPDTVPDAGPSASTLAPFEPTGVVVPVVALDNTFRPAVVEIEVGDEVLWENRGLNEHNVLRVEGHDWGVEVQDFQPGDLYAHLFTEPGEYRYYCSIHGSEDVGMVGTIIVTG